MGSSIPLIEFAFNGVGLRDWIIENCGSGSYGKKISPTLKNLPSEYLEPLLQAMMVGDDPGISLEKAAVTGLSQNN